MTAKIDILAAAPSLIKEWQRVSLGISAALDPGLTAAARSGDMKALAGMLAADVSVHADGGGKRPAALAPIVGFEAVMNAFQTLVDHFRTNGSKLLRAGFDNGLPGFITREADGELQTTALDIENGKIAAIYVVRNPDKLRHLH